MHLLNILWRKKVEVSIFLLSLVIVIISIYPLVIAGRLAAFFSIDPDVVYVANALSYIKWKIIGYYDHPGVPSIYLISQFLLPFRVYAKFILKEDFIDFVYRNYDYIFMYLRYFQSAIFFLGLNIFFNSIYRFTKQFISIIFSTLLLMSFGPVYYLGLSISAETFNMLLISTWIYCLVSFSQRKKVYMLYVLLFISGLLFSNRATNILYLFSGFLIIYFNRKNITKKLSTILIGFMIGLWPVKDNIVFILKRIFFFANSSGIHGAGSGQLFDTKLYIDSLVTFWNRDFIFSITILTLPVFILFFNKKVNNLFKLIAFFAVLFSFMFAKFPLAHYQVPNYLFVVFTYSYFFAKFNKFIKVFLITILSLYVSLYPNNYLSIISSEMKQVSTFEKFVATNISKEGEVWEWARSKRYAYLWTNSYGSNVFSEQIKNDKIPLSSLDDNLFKKCWDNLYVQEVSFTQFNSKYKDKNLVVSKIEGSQNLLYITSNHCTTKP